MTGVGLLPLHPYRERVRAFAEVTRHDPDSTQSLTRPEDDERKGPC